MTRWPRRHPAASVVAGVAVLIIAFRVTLPYGVEERLDAELRQLPQYDGDVDDVDLALWRGAATVEGIRVVRDTGEVPVPFFAADEVRTRIEWGALLEGKVVTRVTVIRPQLNFVASAAPDQAQMTMDEVWFEGIRDLVPFRLERLRVREGEVHFRDYGPEPPVNVYLQDVSLEVRGLTNMGAPGDERFAEVTLDAVAMQGADFALRATLDALTEAPTFDLTLSLQGLDLTTVNPLLEAYADLDVKSGTASVYAEVAAKDGRFDGYVKPLLEGLDVLQAEDIEEGLLGWAWEALVGAGHEILEAEAQDRTATRIPVSGTFDDPEADAWALIWNLVENAFVQVIRHGIEGSISFGDVEAPEE